MSYKQIKIDRRKKGPFNSVCVCPHSEKKEPNKKSMPRIAQKEMIVNLQIKMQLEKSIDKGLVRTELPVFDSGWGRTCVDPETGKPAKLYDHVPRCMKFAHGGQIWILVPRYAIDGVGLIRVLPSNLCVYKHYVVEEIQDTVDDAVEMLLGAEKTKRAEQIQRQLDGSDVTADHPCSRTKWLWTLWFFKNLLLIESVLRMVHFMNAVMTGAGETTLSEILNDSDYLTRLRINEPEDWLKIVIQTAWNSGRPLVPLRDSQTLRKVLSYLAVMPLSNR